MRRPKSVRQTGFFRFGVLLLCWVAMSFAGYPGVPSDRPPMVTAPSQPEFLSPTAIAVTPDGKILYIACATAHEVIAFDVARSEVTERIALPPAPSGLVLSKEGKRLYITCAAAESRLCVVETSSGKLMASIPAGHTAMCPILSKDEDAVFLCDRFNDSVAFIDLRLRKETTRVQVEREPVSLALTPDGKYLFVANQIHSGPSDKGVVASSITVIDVTSRRIIKHIPLTNGSTLLRSLCTSPDGRFIAVAHTLARFHLPTTHVTLGWMNDNVLSLIDVAEMRLLNTVVLDDPTRGAANPWAVAWTADGKSICVTHAGTHELTVIDAPALVAKLNALPVRLERPRQAGYSMTAETVGDVPNDLDFLAGLRSRIKLPGNGPRALALAGHKALVACYFSDSLAVVDTDTPQARPTAHAFHPEIEPTMARKGEMYFNDGTLCYQGWQSCASCHSSDARVDGMNWDLQNDGIGNPKNVKSLLLSFQTPPVMSMGVRADAATAIRAGLRYILFADLPESYAEAIDEFVKSLKAVPSPWLLQGRLSKSAERGKQLFFAPSVGCAKCHVPPLFTDLKPHAVGTGKFDEPTDEFYTPTLIEVWRTAPYLHDGSAATVRDALSPHNGSNRRGHTSQLNSDQINDLTAYVLSL